MKLEAITANLHVVKGRTTGAPLRLLLTFDDGRRLRLGSASDGATMVIDHLPLDPPSRTTGFGEVTVADFAGLIGYAVVGAGIAEVRALSYGAAPIGVRLGIEGGAALHIWVDGDELWWGDDAVFAAHIWPDDKAPAVGERIAM